jgi:hypothetical protein
MEQQTLSAKEIIQHAWLELQLQKNSQAFIDWYRAGVKELEQEQGSQHGS